MPRYYFDVYDGHSSRDETGVICPNMQSAFALATRFAGELLRDASSNDLWQEDDWKVSVRDENCLQLFAVVVMGTLAPAGRDLLRRQMAKEDVDRAWAFPAPVGRQPG